MKIPNFISNVFGLIYGRLQDTGIEDDDVLGQNIGYSKFGTFLVTPVL